MQSKSISLAITALLALSFLALIPIAVLPVHAETAPTITPQTGEYLVGPPTQTLTLTVTWAGTDTVSVQLYAEASPSCIDAAAGTPVGAPITTSGSTVTITPLTAGDQYICAVMTDGTTTYTSGVTSFTVSTPITSFINNDENTVSIESGQSAALAVTPSGGAPPYTYAWHAGDACAGAVLGTSASYTTPAQTYVGPATHDVVYFSVAVTDSVISTPGQTDCEVATVLVYPAFSGTLTIGPCGPLAPGGVCELDSQQGEPALTAVVTFAGGVGPWYSVTIYSGTDSVCAGDTHVVAHMDDINGSEAILNFPAPSTPSSTTYFCAVISDMSSVPNPVTLGPAQINTSPALSAPTFSIDPSQTDYGVITNFPLLHMNLVSGTVQWMGGTSPYFVVLTSGSQKSCAAPDNLPVTPTSVVSGTLWTGALGQPPSALAAQYVALGYSVYYTTGSTMTWSFTAPTSSTYYCAIVFDSSLPSPSQTYTASGALFDVESLFAVNSPKLTSQLTELQSPYYEGVTDTATVSWSGGTGPFVVSLYVDPTSSACAPTDAGYALVTVTPGFNPQTGVAGDSATFSFLTPNAVGTYYYCAVVTDVNGNTVSNGPLPLSPGTPLVIAPYLGTVVATFTPPTVAIDAGQTETLTIVATWTGGSAPYTATLYSGSSATSCNSKISSLTVGTATATFTTTSSKSLGTTYYCVGVTDSSVPVSSGMSNVLSFSTVAPPVVSLPASFEIAAGSGTTLTPIITSAGVAPDFVQWFIGAGCVAANAVTGAIGPIPPGTGAYMTGVITSTTTYSVLLSDSSLGSPAATSCASITVTVNNGPMGVATIGGFLPSGLVNPLAGLIYVANPASLGTVNAYSLSVLDSDSHSVITTIPLTADDGLCLLNPVGVTWDPTFNNIYVSGVAAQTTGATCPALVVGTGWVADVNPLTNTQFAHPLDSFAVGANPQGLAVDVALDTLYVANNGANTVSPCSTVTDTCGAAIPVGPGPMGVAVDQNTHTVFVTDNDGNTISVIQPSLNPPPTYHVTTVNVGFEPTGVAVNPANDNVYVTNTGSGTVTVLNGFTYNTIATIKVGGMPTGIDINGNFAYVANEATNAVTVINLSTNTPLSSTIAVGGAPFGVAVDAPNGYVVVTNSNDNTVSFISLATNQVVATTVVP